MVEKQNESKLARSDFLRTCLIPNRKVLIIDSVLGNCIGFQCQRLFISDYRMAARVTWRTAVRSTRFLVLKDWRVLILQG